MSPLPCANCGAMMQPEPDGRTYACHYCKTRVQVAIDGKQIAAGMHLDLGNVDAFLQTLASTLAQGFAEHSKVTVHGGRVDEIFIDLDTDHFVARREGSRVITEHKRVVRGIALKTRAIAVDQWIEELTDSLAKLANTNARAAWVLSNLGGRR